MTKVVYSLRPGAPALRDLKIRLSVQKEYLPSRSDESDDKTHYPVYRGYEGVMTLLEAMQYDADGVYRYDFDPFELVDGIDQKVIFELVDADGNVWSESEEVPDEGETDNGGEVAEVPQAG